MFGFVGVGRVQAFANTCVCEGWAILTNKSDCDSKAGKSAWCITKNECSCFTIAEKDEYFKNNKGVTAKDTCVCEKGATIDNKSDCNYMAGKFAWCKTENTCSCFTTTEWDAFMKSKAGAVVKDTCVCANDVVDSSKNGCDASAGKSAWCKTKDTCSCFTTTEKDDYLKNKTGAGAVVAKDTCVCENGVADSSKNGCDDTVANRTPRCLTTNTCACYSNSEWNKLKDGLGVSGSKCNAVGDICCEYTKGTGDFYCENGLICKGSTTAGVAGQCANPGDTCGSSGLPCCSGNSCSSGLTCQDNLCLSPGTVELPKYPDEMGFKFANSSLGDVLGGIIKYIYIFAGFALIVVLIMGGFSVLTSSGVPEKAKIGYDKITQGITGFIIIFLSYMVVLLIQAIFKVKILF